MSSLIELAVAVAGERLDRYLAEQLSDLSRSRLQKLIAEGQVQINGSICTCKKEPVDLGDWIQIQIPEATSLTLQPEAIPLDVLYEDASIIIVNKPAGMVVHPAAGHDTGTLVNALLAHCGSLPGINGVQRPGIVHRLDKDTTGAIVVAKTEVALVDLQAQFKVKTARRTYWAVVYGCPPTETGTIDAAIGRHPGDRYRMAVVPSEKGGRSAVTHWQVQEHLGNYSLLQFDLDTGRTHQIRVHAAHIGHPVVGDPTYASSRKSIGVNLTGQALHAWRLQLRHPVSQAEIVAIAPPPPEFTTLLEVLRRRV